MAVDDSYTKLLLHFDGEAESTTFTDESGKTVTANGNTRIAENIESYKLIMPTMTANNAPEPYTVAVNYSVISGYEAYKSFNLAGGLTHSVSGVTSGILSIDLGSGNGEAVCKYTFGAQDGFTTRAPKNWTFEGSNNNSDWTVLDTQTNITSWPSGWINTFSFSNTTEYRYYRLNISANGGDSYLVYRSFVLYALLINRPTCGVFDGDGDYLSLADSDDFYFGNGDFTIDTWLYIDSTISGNWPAIFAQRTNGSSGISCYLMLADKKVRFEYSTNGASPIGTTFNTTLNTNQWYHIALVRNGATITCYINGVAEATTVNIGTSTIYNSSAAVLIGWLVGSAGVDCYLKGYIDEMRISKGIARWTANFTPPTAEYGAAVPTGRARRFAQIIYIKP